MNNPLKKEYLSSLTPLRGVAALWVVVFHIDVSIYYRDLGGLLPREATGFFSKGYLWVDFFFLLSGFIITHVYGEYLSSGLSVKKVRKFLWARFTRLYPLHFFTLMILVLATAIVPFLNANIVDDSWRTYFSFKALPSHLFLTNAMNCYHFLSWNITAWSIGAEWWTYMLALFLIPLFSAKNKWVTSITTVFAFIALFVLVFLHPNKNLDITWDYGFLRCVFEFALGINMYRIFQKGLGHKWLKYDSVVLVLFMLIGVGFHYKWNDLLFVPMFIMLILAAVYNQTRIKTLLQYRVFKFLGNISYSIYLVHSLWFMVFWFSLPHLKISLNLDRMPFWMRLIYIFVFLFLSILSSYFTYNWVEVKARKYLRKFQE